MPRKWVMAAAALAATALAWEASAQQITVRIGFSDPATTPWGRGLTEMKRMVEAESNGRIRVQLFPSEQLGSLVEQVENVRRGAQEISLASPGWFSQFYPRIDMLELPFLMTDWDQVQRVLQSDAFNSLVRSAEKETGLLIYGKFPYGFRHIANSKRPVRTLDDLKGMKLRVQNSPAHIAIFRALGANPVAIAWGETYQAVQTGVVDGLENAHAVLAVNKFPEVAKYVSGTKHLFGMLLAYVNPKFRNGLSEQDRALLDKGMAAAEATNIKSAQEADDKAVADLKAMGTIMNEVSPETIKAMRAAVQTVYDNLGPKFEPELSGLQKAAAGR